MKVKIFRYSGTPIDVEAKALYDADWKRVYDLAEQKADKIFNKSTGSLTRVPKMIVLQRLLKYAERLLLKKYNVSVEVELPKSQKAWAALVAKYQAPILVAQRSDSKGNVLIIMDEMQG